MPDPLIITLTLDQASQARLDDLRTAYFPPERNHLAAHVTLFHALPGDRLDRVAEDLAEVAERSGFTVTVAALRSLGRGVALSLDSADLLVVRADLARRWAPWLTRQDRQGYRPHVTVQNKVSPETARSTYDELVAGFAPWPATATGLALWHYRGGPWAPAGASAFRTPPPRADPPAGR